MEVTVQMKHFNFKKILMMLALVIIVQNGAVVVVNTNGDADSYSEDAGVAPCSDLPSLDDDYD